MKTILLISFLSFFLKCEGANILFYFVTSTFSHRIAVWPLVEGLADKGHNVTFLSGFPPLNRHPNVTEFFPESFKANDGKVTEESILQLRLLGRQNEVWDNIPKLANRVCELVFKDPEVQEWIDRSKFDLVVLGGFWNECGLAIAYKHKAKFIQFSPTSFLMWWNDDFGHPPESSWIPDLDIQIPLPMSFLDKVYNTLRPLYWKYWVLGWNHEPEADRIIRKYLDVPEMPSIPEMWKNTSLILINTHFSFEFARSLPPLYVSVGGLHIREEESKRPLPTELSQFVEDSGENGFVYFSFGSVAKASAFPPELLQIFYDVFESFGTKIRFVWSFDMDRPKEMPSNVLTIKWAPQHAILAHKNIKGFITQGGAMSLQEAIHFRVPAILFPLFGDQDNNAAALERNGCGIKLEIRGLERETLRKAISDLLTDTRYKSGVNEVSKRFKDRPNTALDTAVWWTEYVLRTEDTSFLKPLSMNQSWYEIRLLDVWAFIFCSLLAVLLLIVFVIRFCFCVLTSKSVKLKKS